jgi:hypothetical protein
MSSKRTPVRRISSGGLPAAATRPIGTGVGRPSMKKASPSDSWKRMRGAASRHFASMKST